jgi:hypothetical protein
MTTVDEVIRSMARVQDELGGSAAFGRVAAALAEIRNRALETVEPEPAIEVIPPTPPPSTLPPALQPRWDVYEDFLVELKKQFGMVNNDQLLTLAEVAARLALVGPVGAHPYTTWETFIGWLVRLTTFLGHLNEDQYLWVLITAAQLTWTSAAGGIGEAPPTGNQYARNGLTEAWEEVTHDGGFF